MLSLSDHPNGIVLGRYVLHDEIAAGGMASVHIGRMRGPGGFSRTVAIKRLLPHFARDPEFVGMFLDEARLAARVRHPNVVGTLDVGAQGGELFLVMEYVHGLSLSALVKLSRKAQRPVPLGVAASVILDTLYGLEAAHEATTEMGQALEIVHRDVSPQNVLVGVDGTARVLDFGIAKAAMRMQETRDGHFKGKLAYMSPEQLGREPFDRRSDIYATSVVLWEMLTGERLFDFPSPAAIIHAIRTEDIEPPSRKRPDVPEALDAAVLRGLAKKPADRFLSALAMAGAVERAVPRATPREVAVWVEDIGHQMLAKRAARVANIESLPGDGGDVGRAPPELDLAGLAPGDVKQRAQAATLMLTEGAAPKVEPTMVSPGASTPAVPTASPATLASPTSPVEKAPEAPGRRSTAAVAAAIGLLLLAVVGVFAWRASHPSTEPGDVPVSEPAPAPPSATVVAEKKPAVDTPAEGPSAEPRTPTTSSPATSQAKPKQPGAKRPQPGCDPPYTVDESGVKRFITRCL